MTAHMHFPTQANQINVKNESVSQRQNVFLYCQKGHFTSGNDKIPDVPGNPVDSSSGDHSYCATGRVTQNRTVPSTAIRRCLFEKILIDVSQVIQGHITILIHEQFCPGQVVFIRGS